MKFLIDTKGSEVQRRMDEFPELVAGQLLTPLTRYKNWGGLFAIDNGAYSGLDREGFCRLLRASEDYQRQCIFVAIPDIVGNAARTVELYFAITELEPALHPWSKKWALVAQDGLEDQRIDWRAIRCLFIGGTDRFKDSQACVDIVKTAKAIGIPVHVGRVNTWPRYRRYMEVGADTCDGSGIARYDHMLEAIARELNSKPHPMLFDDRCELCQRPEHAGPCEDYAVMANTRS